MEAIKLCRLDTPIIFIEARINLSRFVVTGCAAKTSATVTFPSLNLISLVAFCFNIWLSGVASCPSLVSWIKRSVDRFVIVSIFSPSLRLILILNSFLGSSGSLVFSELFHSLAPRPLAARSISDFLLRSEERFSRNAETDLVCRLLLEKKKPGAPLPQAPILLGPRGALGLELGFPPHVRPPEHQEQPELRGEHQNEGEEEQAFDRHVER